MENCLTNLLYGKYYKIKNDVKIKVSLNKLKYCGEQEYEGKIKHNFFDEKTRLFHWLNIYEVEEMD